VDSSRFQWIPVEFNLSLIVCNKLRMTSWNFHKVPTK
jgi:hypothetical protein